MDGFSFTFDSIVLRTGHRMLRIPGEEYISSCLVPLRRRYSTALKSFLPTAAFFWNSALQKFGELEFGFGLLTTHGKSCFLSETHLAYDLKFPLDSYFRYRGQCISRTLVNWHTCLGSASFSRLTTGLFRISRRHFRYRDKTSRWRPDSRAMGIDSIKHNWQWWSLCAWVKSTENNRKQKKRNSVHALHHRFRSSVPLRFPGNSGELRGTNSPHELKHSSGRDTHGPRSWMVESRGYNGVVSFHSPIISSLVVKLLRACWLTLYTN